MPRASVSSTSMFSRPDPERAIHFRFGRAARSGVEGEARAEDYHGGQLGTPEISSRDVSWSSSQSNRWRQPVD